MSNKKTKKKKRNNWIERTNKIKLNIEKIDYYKYNKI